MKINIIKIIHIIILLIITINILTPKVYADDDATTDEWTEWIEQGKEFSEGETSSGTITFSESNIQEVSNFISGILLGISVVVAVITTAVLGISFIVQSAEEKAKIKESLIPLIVGMIISFGAYTIWRFAIGVFT